MRISELSIERPVLASVMSLVIVLFGVIALVRLPNREKCGTCTVTGRNRRTIIRSRAPTPEGAGFFFYRPGTELVI